MRIACTIVVALTLAACGNGEPTSPAGPNEPTATPPGLTGPAPSATPGSTNPAPASTDGPAPSRAPAHYGTVMILTRTLSGTPVPQVPIELRRIEPCDLARREAPMPSQVVSVGKHVTGADGRAMVDVPIGCYRFTMTAPPGTSPVPEGMHTLYLAKQFEEVYGELRFTDPAPAGGCAADQVVPDLKLDQRLAPAKAKVSQCNGYWAVVAGDVPGDSQRIARYADGKWTTYVAFPHNRCWPQALSDGVPAGYRPYFSC